jgi:hypothetical protein
VPKMGHPGLCFCTKLLVGHCIACDGHGPTLPDTH